MHDHGGLDHVVGQALRNGLANYEPPLPAVLMALAQEAKGAFIDVGANTGVYSLLVAAANPQLSVYGFEPIGSIRELFSVNVAINGDLGNKIVIVAEALSSKDGVVNMQEHVNPYGLIATSSTLQIESEPDCEYRTIEVERVTLDHWVHSREVSPIAFLKVDVEGHEEAVVEGAREVLHRDRPFLVVELLGSANFGFFAEFARRFGYIDLALRPEQALRLDQPVFMPDAWNHLFCPQERAWQFASTCSRIGLGVG